MDFFIKLRSHKTFHTVTAMVQAPKLLYYEHKAMDRGCEIYQFLQLPQINYQKQFSFNFDWAADLARPMRDDAPSQVVVKGSIWYL